MNNLIDIDPDINYFDAENCCELYDKQSFNTKFKGDNKALNVLHLNIRSINKNMDEFILFISGIEVELSVIVLTETWLNNECEFINIPGYRAFHSIRAGGRGGGVSILVASSISSNRLSGLSVVSDYYESCAVSIKLDGKKFK
jgi:hypothetical protein